MRSAWFSLAGLLVLSLTANTARAEDKKVGFVDKTFKDAEGKEFKYVLFVPHDYKPNKEHPLILFLHGAGEREGGTKGPVDVGIGTAIKAMGEKDFQFFVIFPQCARGGNWGANGPNAERALAMMEAVQKEYKIDSKRVYLTGLSLGGMGTWSLALKYPDKFAAIVPICGRGTPAQAEKVKDLPCWCFHGDADTAVRVEGSRDMIEAIKKAGGKPKYTEYPGVGHNSWDKAYQTKELYTWLLEQKLK